MTQLEQAERQLARSRRFEAQGQISAVERLSAQVSRDEVARDLVKAQRERDRPKPPGPHAAPYQRAAADDAAVRRHLTARALGGLVARRRGRESDAGLIKSKGQAADQGIAAANSDYLPQVFAFGQYNFIDTT